MCLQAKHVLFVIAFAEFAAHVVAARARFSFPLHSSEKEFTPEDEEAHLFLVASFYGHLTECLTLNMGDSGQKMAREARIAPVR